MSLVSQTNELAGTTGLRCIQAGGGPSKPPRRLPDITPSPSLAPSFLPQDTTPRAFATEFNPFPPSPQDFR